MKEKRREVDEVMSREELAFGANAGGMWRLRCYIWGKGEGKKMRGRGGEVVGEG